MWRVLTRKQRQKYDAINDSDDAKFEPVDFTSNMFEHDDDTSRHLHYLGNKYGLACIERVIDDLCTKFSVIDKRDVLQLVQLCQNGRHKRKDTPAESEWFLIRLNHVMNINQDVKKNVCLLLNDYIVNTVAYTSDARLVAREMASVLGTKAFSMI